MGMSPGLSTDLSSGLSGSDLGHADRDVIEGLDASVRERVRRAGVDRTRTTSPSGASSTPSSPSTTSGR